VGGPGAAGAVRNALEIQLFGLRRSGNHAVIAWFAQQYPRPIVFLNNATLHDDPYTTFVPGPVPNAIPAGRIQPERIETLRARPKELLIVSYEDVKLTGLVEAEPILGHDACVGPSHAIRRVLVLRDFYNWIASRIRRLEERETAANLERQVGRWLAYAREFTGKTAYLGDGMVRIAFNRWFSDPAYREGLLKQLGIAMRNNASSLVPRAGGGSSFDGRSFSGKAGQMEVLRRWAYLDQPQYCAVRHVFAEKRDKIDRLNDKIFGFTWPFEAGD